MGIIQIVKRLFSRKLPEPVDTKKKLLKEKIRRMETRQNTSLSDGFYTPNNFLEGLPSDVLPNIIEFLPVRDALTLRATSKDNAKIIESPEMWRKRVQRATRASGGSAAHYSCDKHVMQSLALVAYVEEFKRLEHLSSMYDTRVQARDIFFSN